MLLVQEPVTGQLKVLLTGGERLLGKLTSGLGKTDIPVTFLQFRARKAQWWAGRGCPPPGHRRCSESGIPVSLGPGP